MSSKTRNAEPAIPKIGERDATDTIPRIRAKDLLFALSKLEQTASTSYENIRLSLCVAKSQSRRGTANWSLARDLVGELQRLHLVENAPSPRSAAQFLACAGADIVVTPDGRALLSRFRSNPAEAYDDLFGRMLECHAYLRAFVQVVSVETIVVPIITSVKEHVSDRYARTAVLRDDLSAGQWDIDSLIANLERRIGRPVVESELRDLHDGTRKTLNDILSGAAVADPAHFARAFTGKLNEVVIPALLKSKGLGFDWRTQRTVWGFGEQFRTWAISRSHPAVDAWQIYRTATICLTPDHRRLAALRFDSGLSATRHGFLSKTYDSYQSLSKLRGKAGFVAAWELRSVFCLENHCQPTVFTALLGEHYTGSDEYTLQLEIERQRPKHEPPVRVNGRNIGLIRVVKT